MSEIIAALIILFGLVGISCDMNARFRELTDAVKKMGEDRG